MSNSQITALSNQVEREAAKKQEELFAMEKLNDALNEKLKSLSMEVCVCVN